MRRPGIFTQPVSGRARCRSDDHRPLESLLEEVPAGDLLLRSKGVSILRRWTDSEGAGPEGHDVGGGGVDRRGEYGAPGAE